MLFYFYKNVRNTWIIQGEARLEVTPEHKCADSELLCCGTKLAQPWALKDCVFNFDRRNHELANDSFPPKNVVNGKVLTVVFDDPLKKNMNMPNLESTLL